MAEMTYEEALAGLPPGVRIQAENIERFREAERTHDALVEALGDTVNMTIEEWIAQHPLPDLTITQVILSRAGAAFIETYREPLGKRLSIRAHRRWRGRMKAHMTRSA